MNKKKCGVFIQWNIILSLKNKDEVNVTTWMSIENIEGKRSQAQKATHLFEMFRIDRQIHRD